MHPRFAVLAAVGCLGSALAAPVCSQGNSSITSAQARQAAPADARALIQAAQRQAKNRHKAVLVMFHASW